MKCEKPAIKDSFIMDQSIGEIQKLFQIEGVKNGQVQVKATPYLISLPEEKQIQVLREHLDHLKRDLAKYDLSKGTNPPGPEDVRKTQLQVLVQVVQGLLAKIE